MAKETPPSVTIGARLAQIRGLRKLSQQELGSLAGCKKHKVSKYERGHMVPSVDTLAALCRSMNCSADYLLGISNDPVRLAALNDPVLAEILSVAQSVVPDKRSALLEVLKTVKNSMVS